MAASREIRLPFLDHRLVELLLPLPPQWKLNNSWTKWIFRESVAPMLPKQITWRRDKLGFSNPVGQWLRHQWRNSVNDIIEEDFVTDDLGLIDKAAFRERYKNVLPGPFRRDHPQ